MSDQRHERTQPQPRTSERQATRTAQRPAERKATQPLGTLTAEQHVGRQEGLLMGEALVTLGRAGERNITIEKFWVPVEGHLPCGFNVGTLAHNGLEVVMEQQSYRKTYAGTGALKTGLCPIAPIGTAGRIIVMDTTTGEIVEQPWTWHLLRSGGAWSLWQAIKRLLFK